MYIRFLLHAKRFIFISFLLPSLLYLFFPSSQLFHFFHFSPSLLVSSSRVFLHQGSNIPSSEPWTYLCYYWVFLRCFTLVFFLKIHIDKWQKSKEKDQEQ
jgi:hypothetical protein